MKKNLKLVEITSELGAGTRGASLGLGALKVAAFNNKSDFFSRYPVVSTPNYNKHLFSENNKLYYSTLSSLIVYDINNDYYYITGSDGLVFDLSVLIK